MRQEGKLLGALNPVKDPLPILVIAYSVRRLPYVVRSDKPASPLKKPHKISAAYRSEL